MNSISEELKQRESPYLFLSEVYKTLDYENGALLRAVSVPESGTRESEEWLEKGDWLALAKRVGAEKVFFVKNDPVLIFCVFQHLPSDHRHLERRN